MTLDLSRHPCFNESARHDFGRIHLPVAPKCNVQCNFCDRKFDCVNESRPGVTSAVLTPSQALHYLNQVMEKKPNIAVVGIAGPGDPFANPEATLETMRLVREAYPEMLLCVASNGLNVAPYAAELAELAVSHVTLTINAIDPEIAAKTYAWIRPEKRSYRGLEAAEILLAAQFEALRELKRYGVTVKVNTILVPGINDGAIEAVAEAVAAEGVDLFNCIPFCPVEGTPFGEIASPDKAEVAAIKEAAGKHVSLMHHCTRCRADAVGLLGEAMPGEILGCLQEASSLPIVATQHRPNVAVASHEGVLVNQHLGDASRLLIYEPTESGYDLKETRKTPPPGGAEARWQALAEVLSDCRALLVASAGESPRGVLENNGIRTVMMEGLIEEGLEAVRQNRPIRAPLRAEHRCGSGCSGNGMGCM